MMHKKLIVLASLILIVVLIVTACTSSKTSQEDDNNPFAQFSAQTSHITIYSGYNGELATKEITTEKELQQLIDAIDFNSSEWQIVDEAARLKGMYYYYLDLNNGTAIAMYEDEAYGAVGTALTATMSLENSTLPCQMPKKLLQVVKDLTNN